MCALERVGTRAFGPSCKDECRYIKRTLTDLASGEGLLLLHELTKRIFMALLTLCAFKTSRTSLTCSTTTTRTTRRTTCTASVVLVVPVAWVLLSRSSLLTVSHLGLPILLSCADSNHLTDAKQARDLVQVLTEAKQVVDPRLAEMARYGGGGGGRGYGGGRGGRGGGRGGGGGWTGSNTAPLGGNRRW